MKRSRYECVDVLDETTNRMESVIRPKPRQPRQWPAVKCPKSKPATGRDAPAALMRRFETR